MVWRLGWDGMEWNGRHYLGIDFGPGIGLAKKFLFDLRDAFVANTIHYNTLGSEIFLPSSSNSSEDVYSHINRTYHGSLALR